MSKPGPARRTHADLVRIALLAAVSATIVTTAIPAQQAPSQPVATATSPLQTKAARKSHDESEGERVFNENCSRCHAAPDRFSPRISATIVRHMRMRASLSEQDERALLHFFNPQ